MEQVRDYIKQLARIPCAGDQSVKSLVGEIFHQQLPHPGPFDSTSSFLQAYADENQPLLHQIPPGSLPVFSHLDWDLSNVVLSPNYDSVVGVIDWERACFFPEGGRSIHQMCIHQPGWEKLFDGLQFPVKDRT